MSTIAFCDITAFLSIFLQTPKSDKISESYYIVFIVGMWRFIEIYRCIFRNIWLWQNPQYLLINPKSRGDWIKTYLTIPFPIHMPIASECLQSEATHYITYWRSKIRSKVNLECHTSGHWLEGHDHHVMLHSIQEGKINS